MFLLTSNLLYLCAAVVATVEKHWPWAVIMLGVTTCSVLYHLGVLARMWDVMGATIAFVYGCWWYLARRARRPWTVPLFATCMLVCLAIPKSSQAEYDAVHPWAHVFGGLASLSLAAS